MKSVVTWLFVAQLIVIASSKGSFLKLRQNSTETANNAEIKNDAVYIDTVNPSPAVGNETNLVDAFCFINNNGTVYDLNDLTNDEADYTVATNTGKINFNICRNALNSCAGEKNIASWVSNLDPNNCVSVAGNQTVTSEFTLIENDQTNSTVLRMKLPEGDVCKSDEAKRYTTYIEFTCDEDADAPVISKNALNINSCENRIYMTTKYACPKLNVYALWNKIQDNKWIFGAIIMGLGVFFCFFGENFLKITQVIAGAALTIIIFMYLVFSNTSIEIYTWQFWLIIVIAAAIGCLAGWFMSQITWLPGLVFGILLGFVVGFVLYNIGLRFIDSNPEVVFWVTMSVCVIGGALLGYFKEEEIAIISTSIVGAYAIIRGLSIWCGGFPDERQVYELGSKGEWDQMKDMLDATVYAYLAGFFVLSAIGMWIQFKYFYDGSKKEKKEKNQNKNDEERGLKEEN